MGYEALVLKALRSVLMGQRGQVCVIKLRKLVRACGLEPTWFNSFNVRRVLEDLRWHGLIDLYSGGEACQVYYHEGVPAVGYAHVWGSPRQP